GRAGGTAGERGAWGGGGGGGRIGVAELVPAIGDEIPDGLDLKIYDGNGGSASAPLYDGHARGDAEGDKGTLRQKTTVDVASHRWTLVLTDRAGLTAVDRSRPLLVLLVGLLGSGLLP